MSLFRSARHARRRFVRRPSLSFLRITVAAGLVTGGIAVGTIAAASSTTSPTTQSTPPTTTGVPPASTTTTAPTTATTTTPPTPTTTTRSTTPAQPSASSTTSTVPPSATSGPALPSSPAASPPTSAVHSAAGPVFTCSVPTSFLSQGSPSTQLFFSAYGSGSVTYSTLGLPFGQTYNGLGFDTVNDYLYATILGTNTLLQIDSTGAVTTIGPITGLPSKSNAPADGAFDASGNYWVTGGNGSTTAYEINVTSSPPAVIKTVALSQAWPPIDFSLSGGFMWGLAGTTLYRVDLATGTVSTFPGPSGIVSGNFGAAWTFSNGNVGFSNNGTGDIYQISIMNPSGTPTFGLVSHYTGPVAGPSNDGAACVAQPTDLSISKTGPALVSPSGTITWTLAVTNHGPGNSSGYAVNDAVPAGVTNVSASTAGCKVSGNNVLCSEGALSDGASFTITLTGTAPNTNGTCFTNTATVTGNETDPNPSNNTSSFQTCTTAGITLVKSSTANSFNAPGILITYHYLVTNTSTSQTLTSINVTDPQPGLSAVTCPQPSLAAGASETCTATYTTTQADVDRGSITNTGTAHGTPPTGPVVTASSTLTVPAVQNASIALDKTANVPSFNAPGTLITYSYKVTNTGNVTLHSVTVTDPMPGLSSITCNTTTLAPGANETCTATYTTTQADVDRGNISNTGTATGTPPVGGSLTARSSLSILGIQNPSINMVKTSTVPSFTAPGTVITYDYKITNTGNVTLHSVTVTDPHPALSAVTCPNSTLAPQASETCTATYTTTQADVDAGSVTNTGTATGTPPTGPAVTHDSSVTVPAIPAPAINMVKSASVQSFATAGVPITYSYLVTNTGNVTLHAVDVTDPHPNLSTVNCQLSTLTPGESETCTATYTTTQADVDRGSITNTGTATGTPPTGPAITHQSTVVLPAAQTPAIGLHKSANIPSFYGSRSDHHLQLPGEQLGQRDSPLHHGDRPPHRPVGHLLPRHDAGPGRFGDLYRHLHHHPGRRGRRLGHQHRHRPRNATDRAGRHRLVDRRRPGGPASRHQAGQDRRIRRPSRWSVPPSRTATTSPTPATSPSPPST